MKKIEKIFVEIPAIIIIAIICTAIFFLLKPIGSNISKKPTRYEFTEIIHVKKIEPVERGIKIYKPDGKIKFIQKSNFTVVISYWTHHDEIIFRTPHGKKPFLKIILKPQSEEWKKFQDWIETYGDEILPPYTVNPDPNISQKKVYLY